MAPFRHKSPLMSGVPFAVFMVLGTYTLSLFVQHRFDFEDQHKSVVEQERRLKKASPQSIEDELQELQKQIGDTRDYEFVKTR